ncbi:MAG TPA: bifunctional DNA-formamidopyrimidine glycosylase/DNA-(apurinic or apyrimidinic site) lyase [Xanthobacteraceae bacterium]|nr:bifunctional DNA-formamidopyrimidine glycosylase/DNA-(apurinic or apyrimidinic site) lyase [Xanthobacteraceae bacterium]
MPELPEVETVRRGLLPAMLRARFLAVSARREDLRWPLPPAFTARLKGVTVEGLTRRGKYLLAELSGGHVLIMHLGMSGSFRISNGLDAPPESAHDHVVFVMSSGATVTFNDPRRFGFMLLIRSAELRTHKLMRAIGPEPLDASFDGAALGRACAGRTVSLKAALSNQKIVAGLGNIYVCEALNRARLSPRRKAATLDGRGAASTRAAALAAAIKAVLTDAIEAGGSSLRDHRRPDGELGLFQHRFRVYDRAGAPCPNRGCTGRIRRIVQNGRSTFFCPVCQR